MRTKKILLLLTTMLILAVVSAFSVSADVCNGATANSAITAVTLTAPASGATITGSAYAVTGTYTGNSSGNITYYISDTVSCTDTTVTACNSTFSCTSDTTAFGDASSATVNATAFNSSGSQEATTSFTNIDIDNTAPTCTVSTVHDQIRGASEVLASCTGTEAIDSSPDYVINMSDPLNDEVTGSSTTSATFIHENFIPTGDYNISCFVTDNANLQGICSTTLRKLSEDEDVVAVTTTGETVALGKGLGRFSKLAIMMILISLGAAAVIFSTMGKK